MANLHNLLRRELRRYFRSSPLLAICGPSILAVGLASCAISLGLLIAGSSPRPAGTRSGTFATISEEVQGGGSVPISWRRLTAFPGELAACSRSISVEIQFAHTTTKVSAAAVSSSFFKMVALPLAAGRDFGPPEHASSTHIAILSMAKAVELFHSPQGAVGRLLLVNGEPYEIAGVAPAKFKGLFGDAVSLWVPAHSIVPLKIQLPPNVPGAESVWQDIAAFYGIASSETLSTNALVRSLNERLPARDARSASLHVSPGLTIDPVGDETARKWLRFALLLSVAFSLVICLSFSLLVLARAPKYAGEVRLKRALGANRGRLIGELLVGPAAIVLLSLLLGAAIFAVACHYLATLPGSYGMLASYSFRPGALALAAQIPFAVLLTGIVALLPAIELIRDSGIPLNGHTQTASRRARLMQQIPVAVQVSFCLATWILAGMMISTSLSVLRAPLGFDPHGLVTLQLEPSAATVTFSSNGHNSYPDYGVQRAILAAALQLPGARAAALSSDAPLDFGSSTVQLRVAEAAGNMRTAYEARITPRFVATIQAQIVRGRSVVWPENAGAANEVVLSRLLARELWGTADPVGSHVTITYPAFAGRESFATLATVVGVANDMRLAGPASAPVPVFFDSMTAAGSFVVDPRLIVAVDGGVDPESLRRVMAGRLDQLFPDLKVASAASVEDLLRQQLRPSLERAEFALSASLVMALLAFAGLLGTLTYAVESRKKELALRICLGASRNRIRGLVLIQALRCAAGGVALALPLMLALARLSSSQLLGALSWSSMRAVVLASACLVLAAGAALRPAQKAANSPPGVLLKEQ